VSVKSMETMDSATEKAAYFRPTRGLTARLLMGWRKDFARMLNRWQWATRRRPNGGRVATNTSRKLHVPRVISFIVLLAIVLLVGTIFFQVMAQFIVPLFLACVLLVVFQPLHAQILKRLPRHPRVCALITTLLILLAVLLPLTWLGWKAYVDFHALLAPAEVSATNAAAVRRARPDEPGELLVDDSSADEGTASTLADSDEEDFTEKLNKIAFRLRNDFARVTKIKFDDDRVRNFVASAQAFVGAKVLSGAKALFATLVGLAIMVISVYYFLADGPAMIRTVMYLSPLESRYEQELLERFGSVSRAVVVATLLSAVVQGALAGIGYSFALPHAAPIFLLTALTMVTALVPFVGAAAVWIPVCIWVYFYGGERIAEGVAQQSPGNVVPALVLAIYSTVVVSGVDNVIKPFILHGQSKLHPLLALLSILGGVQVLGPIGILVGPMLVSFFQALLNMLRKELDSLGGAATSAGEQLAAVVEATSRLAADNEQPANAQAVTGDTATATDGRGETNAKTPPSGTKSSGSERAKRRGKR
jgi:predicted PurR-regulated permease PerM